MADRDYTPNIIKVLYAYPPGSPSLVTSLNALCHTAEENGFKDAQERMAQAVCEGLHLGAASGLKCLQCYEAEHGYAEEERVLAEMEAVRQAKKEEKP